MKKLVMISLLLLAALVLLAACDLTPDEVANVASTVQSMPPSELAGLVATAEALPPAEQTAVAQVASQLPPLSPDQVTAVVSTVQAAQATATAVGAAAAAGERVNATQVPNEAPRIVYFFASAASSSSMRSGIRYHLNYTTENANRVEIFGNVMENPVEGTFSVYNPSNSWVLWAANDSAWVEQALEVKPDADTGSTLSNVTVDSTQITLTFRDPQFVDGDIVNVDVNGARVLERYTLQGRHVSFPLTLQSGENTVAINVQNVGLTAPLVGEITISNVTQGNAVQITRGLNRDETETFVITAP